MTNDNGQPIITQPSGLTPPSGVQETGEWMGHSVGAPNCPPGLEYLMTVDQIFVKQKIDWLKVFTGCDMNNQYSIENSLGQKVYFSAEVNDCGTRNLCGPIRPFDMRIFDNYKNEVMHLDRPLACTYCFFPCCLQSMEVSAPPGNVIGSIEQSWSIFLPWYRIKNQSGETMLQIKGPFCLCNPCGEVVFKVLSLTGEQVGKISKKRLGLLRAICTDATFFAITFPIDLDVRMRAVLLAATFLIDAMFYERFANYPGQIYDWLF